MSLLKKYKVTLCDRSDIKDFIEENHYSKNINGCISDYCFKIEDDKSEMVGAMFFGRMAMAGQYKRFSDLESDVIELRRLCCIDDTPRNTESYFIGKAIRWLKINTKIKIVVSYSDLEQGHTGIIYRASNFKFEGFRIGAKVIMYKGKAYHDKSIRTKYNGELKPFAIKLKNAIEIGEAYYKKTKGKNCFTYNLR